VHIEHAALEGFNGSDGTRAHHAINDEGALRWLHMAVEEFLHQTDIICAIEATMTDGGHNSLHLKSFPCYAVNGDIATSAAGYGQHNIAYRSL